MRKFMSRTRTLVFLLVFFLPTILTIIGILDSDQIAYHASSAFEDIGAWFRGKKVRHLAAEMARRAEQLEQDRIELAEAGESLRPIADENLGLQQGAIESLSRERTEGLEKNKADLRRRLDSARTAAADRQRAIVLDMVRTDNDLATEAKAVETREAEERTTVIDAMLAHLQAKDVEEVRRMFVPALRGKITASSVKAMHQRLLRLTRGKAYNLEITPAEGLRTYGVALDKKPLTRMVKRADGWLFDLLF